MTGNPEGSAVISGIGISRVGRRLGVPALELTTEAATAAIADAGLATTDIDGVATLGDTLLDEAATQLGVEPTFRRDGVGLGGLLSPVMSAVLAVADRRARHVLSYRTVQMMGGAILPPADVSPKPRGPRSGEVTSDVAPLLTYHAYSAANWLAMHCQRHMHLYGTTKAQLGALAVNSRKNAALNPLAVYTTPMYLDDYLNARSVSSPFGLFDCDVPVDGSIAFVVSHRDHTPDCPNLPVRVAAMGGASGAGGWIERPDYPKMASAEAASAMWSRTDLKPADVDIAELYDGFTFLTIAWVEALGLCEYGEGGPFVEDSDQIALDGSLPLNTYGGQLSAGRMHGYWVLHEACLQLRGAAGARQVLQPEVAVVSAGGGPIAGCLLLTR
ncbi:MAG: thiolase family protein [Acidimicrobiia bacterium]